jgi:Transmembrane amino acid transporter protein
MNLVLTRMTDQSAAAAAQGITTGLAKNADANATVAKCVPCSSLDKSPLIPFDDDDGNHKTSVLQCIFNLSNILMGVGLLGLPYVYRLTGYVGGTACILVLATICWRTAILIGRCLSGKHVAQLVGGPPPKQLTSFPDIARASFGETGCYVLSTILYFEVRFSSLPGALWSRLAKKWPSRCLSLSASLSQSRIHHVSFIFSIHRYHDTITAPDNFLSCFPVFRSFLSPWAIICTR